MSENKARHIMQVQVGAFVAVGLFILMLVLFLLGSEKSFFERQYKLIARFGDISGVRLGAPVHLAGFNVGTVNEILFDEKIEKKKVKLVLAINSKYQDRIREDSQATIVTQGLLGDRIVFLSVGSPDKKKLEDGDEIVARSPAGFTQLLEKGDVLLENVNEAAKHIEAILRQVREKDSLVHGLIYDPEGEQALRDLGATAENFRDVSAKINDGQGTIGALVNDASLYNDMKTLMGKANRNKLIRAVIRETLRTKEEKSLTVK